IVGATFILVAFFNGLLFSFGLYQKPLIEEFGWTRAQTSLSATIALASFSISSLVSGIIVDKYGPRVVCALGAAIMGLGIILTTLIGEVWHLYLTYGLIFGLGGGTQEKPPAGVITRFFIKKRGIALGIATAGIGVGILVIAPLIQSLINYFGWRWACLITGLIPIIISVPTAAIIMRSSPEDIGLFPDAKEPQLSQVDADQSNDNQTKGFSLIEALALPQFWTLFAISICMNIGLLGVMYHLPAYATDSGIQPIFAATAIGLVGGFSIAGRIMTGILSDITGRRSALIVIFSVLVITLITLIWVKTFVALLLWVFVFGFCYGSMVVAMWGLTADLFGSKAVAGILGAVTIGAGVGGFIGPWTAGYIFDTTNSYDIAFVVFAGAYVAAVVFAILLRPIRQGVII
ncbi:MFS transporter, partial [Chloroflexota bacterium]